MDGDKEDEGGFFYMNNMVNYLKKLMEDGQMDG